MLARFCSAAKTDRCARPVYAPSTGLCLSKSRSFLEATHFLRRYRNPLLAVAAALLLVAASGVSAQKISTSSSSNSVTLPNGTTITANPNTGEITVNLPKTDTTATVNTKDNNNVTAKDNKTQKPLPKAPPKKPAAGGGGGGGKGNGGSIQVTPNDDGSITVTVTNGGQTETVTVNPQKDPNTGATTTTVSTPGDPDSNVSVTNDKNGTTTGTKAKMPNPSGGGGFVVESPGSDGIGKIDVIGPDGSVVGGPTYNGDTEKVEIGPDGIPHTVPKTPEEIQKDKDAKAAKEKEKNKTATGTQGTGTEPGTTTPPAETPTPGSTPPAQGQTPAPGSSSQTNWVNPQPTLVSDSFSGVVVDPTKPPTTVTAYRTGNLSAGDSFSGIVTSDATDATQLGGLVYQVVEKDSSGNQKVVSQTPVSNGVYKGLIPAGAVAGGGVLIGELLKDGKQVGTATPVPIETQTTETGQTALTSDSYKIPSLMQAGKPTAIEFQGGDGDLTTTHVTVGGQPAQELAEGPKETVFQSPTTVTGPTTVTISKNGVTGSGESRNVAVNLSAASKSLETGTQAVLTVKVSGLAGLDKPVSLSLVNSTPAVQLQGGNTQTITIAPTAVQADGTYSVDRNITAEHQGAFNVTATLDGLSIPGPAITESPGGPGISENGGTKEDTKKKCDDCVAAFTTGPEDYDPGKSCAAASACKSTNKDLLAELANQKCHDDNTSNCTGTCGGGTYCGGIYDAKQSHGLSLDASIDGNDPQKCKAKNLETCDATLKIAAGGELICRCSCSQK